jgi:hypothetical protein
MKSVETDMLFKRLMTVAMMMGAMVFGTSAANADQLALTNLNGQYGLSLTSCSVCHSSVPALNVFGDDFLAAGGSKTAYSPTWATLDAGDADGDGILNGAELQAGSDPALAAGETAVTQETASVTGCMANNAGLPWMMLLGLLVAVNLVKRKK